MTRVACAFVLACNVASVAWAQNVPSPEATDPMTAAVVADAAPPAPIVPPLPSAIAPPKRPSLLLPLYASLGALQAADYMSTRAATMSGRGVEANPLMRPIVGHDAAFVAVKAGSAAAAIWIAEGMWKRNRAAAVALMIGVNAGMAAVVSHNYAVAR